MNYKDDECCVPTPPDVLSAADKLNDERLQMQARLRAEIEVAHGHLRDLEMRLASVEGPIGGPVCGAGMGAGGSMRRAG